MARVITRGLLVVVEFDVSKHLTQFKNIAQAYKLLQAVGPLQLDLVA